MITINEQIDSQALCLVSDFEVGDTFKHGGKYYLVVDLNDEDEVTTHKVAFDLQTGVQLDKYKRTKPCLYPVSLVLYVSKPNE